MSLPFSRNKNYLILSIFIFGVLLAAVLIMSTSHVPSSKLNDVYGTKIAVIDSVKLRKEALCFKAHEKTESMLNDVFARARKSEQQMKSECDKIKRDSTLSQKQKTQNISKAETNLATLSSKYNAEIQDVKTIDLKISEYLEKKLYSVIESISKSQKIGLVLNTQIKSNISVFYNTKNVDITDQIVKKLNESVPDVNLDELK